MQDGEAPPRPEGFSPSRTDPRPAKEGRPFHLAILTGLDVRAYRGGEKFAALLAREFQARGVEVHLLSKVDPHEHLRLETTDLSSVIGTPVEFYRVYWVPLAPALPRSPLKFVRSMAWADSLYTFETTPRHLALVVLLGRLLGRRVVVALHNPTLVEALDSRLRSGGAGRWRGRWLRYVLRHADALNVVNAHQVEALAQAGIEGNVALVSNFIEVAPRIEALPREGAFRSLFVGPLDREQKGIDLLAEVARRVLDAEAGISLTIVGSGRDEELVDGLASRFPGRVKHLGFVSEDDLARLYAGSHLLWMTSRVESFSLVALEGYAHGLPMVCFGISGLDEVTAIDPSGRVPPFDASAFAERVLERYRLWRENPDAYDHLREACREGAADRFGLDTQLPRLGEILGIPRNGGRRP